jgi:16S rRNA A1518/A1519 N6-dimethyltransferase RsmA/KsgA/DIM1 with predicted DNA glycosylase/AP lyase activity
MLRKSLAGVVTADQFDTADVAPTARPEDLGVDAWVRLTNAVTDR